jgi:hypothetical protein
MLRLLVLNNHILFNDNIFENCKHDTKKEPEITYNFVSTTITGFCLITSLLTLEAVNQNLNLFSGSVPKIKERIREGTGGANGKITVSLILKAALGFHASLFWCFGGIVLSSSFWHCLSCSSSQVIINYDYYN